MMGNGLQFYMAKDVLINDSMSTDAVVDDLMSFGFIVGLCFALLAWCIVLAVAQWKLFRKAGEPGWASLVPFYCNYVLFKIAFGNGWLFLLTCIPIVNYIVVILLQFKLATAFGKSTGFGFGLLFLGGVFYPILAFGNSQFVYLDDDDE